MMRLYFPVDLTGNLIMIEKLVLRFDLIFLVNAWNGKNELCCHVSEW